MADAGMWSECTCMPGDSADIRHAPIDALIAVRQSSLFPPPPRNTTHRGKYRRRSSIVGCLIRYCTGCNADNTSIGPHQSLVPTDLLSQATTRSNEPRCHCRSNRLDVSISGANTFSRLHSRTLTKEGWMIAGSSTCHGKWKQNPRAELHCLQVSLARGALGANCMPNHFNQPGARFTGLSSISTCKQIACITHDPGLLPNFDRQVSNITSIVTTNPSMVIKLYVDLKQIYSTRHSLNDRQPRALVPCFQVYQRGQEAKFHGAGNAIQKYLGASQKHPKVEAKKCHAPLTVVSPVDIPPNENHLLCRNVYESPPTSERCVMTGRSSCG